MTESGDVYDFSHMFLIVLSVLALTTELFHFATDKFDPQAHFVAVMFVLITLILQKSFLPAMDTIWQTGEGLGMAFMEQATGTRDPLYLAKWLTHAIGKMSFSDVSLSDGPSLVIKTAIFYIISLLLSIVMYLVGMWAAWGLALSKLLALLFIPTLAYKPTRSFFISWLEFFLGFVFLMLILRVTGTLAALAMQSEFNSMGMGQCSAGHLCDINAKYFANADTDHFVLTSALSLLLVGSSFKFAQVFSNAASDMSKYASKSLKNGMKSAGQKFFPTSNNAKNSSGDKMNFNTSDIPSHTSTPPQNRHTTSYDLPPHNSNHLK